MLNRATALLNFADADAQFQRRYCSISPAEALNFNAVCICDNDLMDAVIDKFGKDVDVSAYDENSFRVDVTTSVGNVFYSWIFGFGGRVYISSPDDVKYEYAEMVAAATASIDR